MAAVTDSFLDGLTTAPEQSAQPSQTAPKASAPVTDSFLDDLAGIKKPSDTPDLASGLSAPDTQYKEFGETSKLGAAFTRNDADVRNMAVKQYGAGNVSDVTLPDGRAGIAIKGQNYNPSGQVNPLNALDLPGVPGQENDAAPSDPKASTNIYALSGPRTDILRMAPYAGAALATGGAGAAAGAGTLGSIALGAGGQAAVRAGENIGNSNPTDGSLLKRADLTDAAITGAVNEAGGRLIGAAGGLVAKGLGKIVGEASEAAAPKSLTQYLLPDEEVAGKVWTPTDKEITAVNARGDIAVPAKQNVINPTADDYTPQPPAGVIQPTDATPITNNFSENVGKLKGLYDTDQQNYMNLLDANRDNIRYNPVDVNEASIAAQKAASTYNEPKLDKIVDQIRTLPRYEDGSIDYGDLEGVLQTIGKQMKTNDPVLKSGLSDIKAPLMALRDAPDEGLSTIPPIKNQFGSKLKASDLIGQAFGRYKTFKNFFDPSVDLTDPNLDVSNKVTQFYKLLNQKTTGDQLVNAALGKGDLNAGNGYLNVVQHLKELDADPIIGKQVNDGGVINTLREAVMHRIIGDINPKKITPDVIPALKQRVDNALEGKGKQVVDEVLQNVTPREQKFVDIVNKSDEIRNGASKNPNFSPEKVNSLLKEHADQSAKNLGFTGASDPRFADSLDDAVRSVNDAGTKLNQLKNLKAQLDQLKPNKGAISKILHSFGKESATGAVTEIASTLGGLPPGLAATIVGMGAEHFLPTPQGASGYTTQQAKGLISRLGLPPEPKSGVKAALKQAPGLVGRAAAVGAGSKLRQGLLGPTVLGLNNQ